MIIPNQHRHLTGALSAFAVRMAASASLPVEQLRLTPLRRQPGPPKIPPRQSRPAPLRSRQYTGAMSTTVLRDQRLTPGARVLAGLLVALAGREGYADLTRGYLAAQLGVSSRTVARQLAELRRYCYVATTHLIGDLGQTTGLRVGLLDPLLPFWEAAEEGGDRRASPRIQDFKRRGWQGRSGSSTRAGASALSKAAQPMEAVGVFSKALPVPMLPAHDS